MPNTELRSMKFLPVVDYKSVYISFDASVALPTTRIGGFQLITDLLIWWD